MFQQELLHTFPELETANQHGSPQDGDVQLRKGSRIALHSTKDCLTKLLGADLG